MRMRMKKMREFEIGLIYFLAISGEEMELPVSARTKKKIKKYPVLGYPSDVADSILLHFLFLPPPFEIFLFFSPCFLLVCGLKKNGQASSGLLSLFFVSCFFLFVSLSLECLSEGIK